MVGVSIITFAISHVVPADPAVAALGDHATGEQIAAFRHEYGLDRSLVDQYLIYVGGLARGDLGTSIRTRRPVASDLADFFPATIELALAALLVALVLGLPAGVWSAVRRGGAPDHADSVLAGDVDALGSSLRHLILPALTLGYFSTALVARMTRASMLESLGQDYIRTARMKGLRERVVVWRHALRNALIPTVTILGLTFASLLSGAVLTETIFSWPGLGRYATASAVSLDFPAVMGVTLLAAVAYPLANLVVDVVYYWLDPRLQRG